MPPRIDRYDPEWTGARTQIELPTGATADIPSWCIAPGRTFTFDAEGERGKPSFGKFTLSRDAEGDLWIKFEPNIERYPGARATSVESHGAGDRFRVGLSMDELLARSGVGRSTRESDRSARELSTPIASLRRAETFLQSQIVALDRDNATKLAEIARIDGEIEARKRQIQEDRERTRNIGILGALLGVPAVAVVALSEVYASDARLKALEQEKSQAAATRAAIDRKKSSLATTKARVGAALAVLDDTEEKLVAALAALPQDRARTTKLSKDAVRFVHQTALVENLTEQVRLLTQLRHETASLGVMLDELLGQLHTLLEHAEQAAEETREGFEKLLEVLIDAEPEEAARRLLHDQIRSRVQETVSGAIDRLLAHSGIDTNVATVLRGPLIEGLMRT